MEMHLNSVVVTLTDENNKPFREFDSIKLDDKNHRKCKMVMPFDTEYKILVKNTLNNRIRMVAEIDGTDVFSTSGLIMGARSIHHIERFLNSAKRFKFVKADSSEVQDPTSKENGLIKLKVWEEKQIPLVINNPVWHTWPENGWGGPFYDGPNNGRWNSLHKMRGLTPPSYSTYTAQINCQANSAVPLCATTEAGATVEGSHSNQKFSSTHWNGDNTPDPLAVFTFDVSGFVGEVDPEYQKYLELKKKFG
jgi:hypothetical protein